MQKMIKLIYAAAAVGLTWYVSSIFTGFGLYNWYAAFDKPGITPPDAVFPIVWSILYLLMIAAFYRGLVKAGPESGRKLNQLFIGQLLLQVIWTYIFFAIGHIGVAFGVIVLLILVVYKLIRVLYPLDRTAAWLLVPYLLWLIYAALINLSFIYAGGMVVEF